jgi:hypothetical protein
VANHNCVDFDLCQRPAEFQTGHCILHTPEPNKNSPGFRAALAQHLDAGRTDLSRMVAPSGSDIAIAGRNFPEGLVANEVSVPGGVFRFSRCRFSKPVTIDTQHFGGGHIHFDRCRGDGDVSLSVANGIGTLGFFDSTFRRVYCRVPKLDALSVSGKSSFGVFAVTECVINTVTIEGASIDELLDLSRSRVSVAFTVGSCTFGPAAVINVSDAHLRMQSFIAISRLTTYAGHSGTVRC